MKRESLRLVFAAAAVAMVAGLCWLAAQRSQQPAPQRETGRAKLTHTAGAIAMARRLPPVVPTLQGLDPAARRAICADFARTLSFGEARDVLAGLGRVHAIEGGPDLRRALFVRLAEFNPRHALELANEFVEGKGRAEITRAILETWAARDPATAAEWLARPASATWMDEFAPVVIGQWQAVAPDAAAGFVAAMPAGVTRDKLLGQVLAEWRETDFPAALAWARRLDDGAFKGTALVHLSYRWAETDLRGAVAFAEEHAATVPQLLTVVADEWAAHDPQAAAEWARSLPEEAPRARAIASVTAAWAAKAPRDAAAFVATLAPPEVPQAVASAVAGWARENPSEAAAWIDAFPTAALRAQAYPQLLSTWARRDPATAAEWILRLPEDAARDVALDSLSGALAARQPEISLAFAEGISDAALRTGRLEQIVRTWRRNDPAAAAQALADSAARISGTTSKSSPP